MEERWLHPQPPAVTPIVFERQILPHTGSLVDANSQKGRKPHWRSTLDLDGLNCGPLTLLHLCMGPVLPWHEGYLCMPGSLPQVSKQCCMDCVIIHPSTVRELPAVLHAGPSLPSPCMIAPLGGCGMPAFGEQLEALMCVVPRAGTGNKTCGLAGCQSWHAAINAILEECKLKNYTPQPC